MKPAILPPHSLAICCCHLHQTCQLCGQPMGCHQGFATPFGCALICDYCHEQLSWQLPRMKIADGLSLCAGSFYEMPLKRVMALYKDKQDLSALLVLYHVMCQIPKPTLGQNTIIVPVPTTKDRLIKRGFNPVLTLARFLSYWWQLPIWQGIARIDNQTHQRGLDKQSRLCNVKEDFCVMNELPTRSLILFDDVVTTGATVSAVAQTIWNDYPNTKITVVCVLHGTPNLHLPNY